MNKARRRLRVCLICVVMVAIVIGIFYYYHVNRETTMNEGMLVTKNMIPVWIWQ